MLIIYNFAYVAENLFKDKKYLSLFNLKIYNNNGVSYIVVSKKDNQINISDIVMYKNNDDILIKNISNKYEENGKTYFRTKNKNVNYSNLEEQTIKTIIGKVIVYIPIIGFILAIFQSRIITFIIVLLLIIYYLYRKELYRRKRLRRMKKEAYYI